MCRPCFFLKISYQENKTIQRELSTSSESLDDSTIERHVRCICLYFPVILDKCFVLCALNLKKKTQTYLTGTSGLIDYPLCFKFSMCTKRLSTLRSHNENMQSDQKNARHTSWGKHRLYKLGTRKKVLFIFHEGYLSVSDMALPPFLSQLVTYRCFVMCPSHLIQMRNNTL